MNFNEPRSDYCVELERRRLEADKQRNQALHDQSSELNSPDERVRTWERLHQLRLPRDPAHLILLQIARDTALGMDQLLEVQRLRARASR
jgi:hypothetical protein